MPGTVTEGQKGTMAEQMDETEDEATGFWSEALKLRDEEPIDIQEV